MSYAGLWSDGSSNDPATLQNRSWAVPLIGRAAISPEWLRE